MFACWWRNIMIDYEKLKKAHELAEESSDFWFEGVFGVSGGPEYLLFDVDGEEIDCFGSEDELIAKLTELTQPKPKYKIGDKLYFKDDADNIQDFIVGHIEGSKLYREQEYSPLCLHENEVYPTKSELIKTQLRYWSELAYQERSKPIDEYEPKFEGDVEGFECQHVSDGTPIITTDSLVLKKCLKCGEFYKGRAKFPTKKLRATNE